MILPNPIATRTSASSADAVSISMVISIIAAKTAAPNTQTGPPRKDMDTAAIARRNHRPGLPIPFLMMPLFKVRPHGLRHPNLGIGDLPQEKITDSQFTAGSNQQIGIRLAGSVKILSEMLFGDAAVIGCGLSTIAQETINGIDNFGAAAIIQSNIENHSAIAARFGNGLVQFGLNRNIKFVGPSDRAKSDIVLMNVFELLVQVFLQELHQRRNFAAGTLPVFD